MSDVTVECLILFKGDTHLIIGVGGRSLDIPLSQVRGISRETETSPVGQVTISAWCAEDLNLLK